MSATMPWLAGAAKQRPDHVAVATGSGDTSYARLAARAAAAAGALAAAGVRPGERVGLLLGNGLDFVALTHATSWLAAALVPFNARLTATELAALLVDAAPRILVCDEAHRPVAEEAAARAGIRCELADSLRQHPSPAPGCRPLDPRADALLLFTSGTTGRPKAVRLGMANLLASARLSAQRLGVCRDDRWLACMPLFHVGGLSIVFRSALYRTTLVLHERFDAERVARALVEDRITVVSLVPTMLARLLEILPEPPRALRCALLGGAGLPEELRQRALGRGWPLSLSYGLTECASQVATTPPGDGRPGAPPLTRTLVEIRSEDDRPLGPEAVGEICVRGPQVMSGYLDRPEETARALRGGWLHTGDVGCLDGCGRLHVLERRSDLIVTGGENVYPAEVEAALREHPGVADAAVIGRSDPEWGQRVVAVLVAAGPERPGDDALREHCRARLADFKRPRAFEWRRDLPRTPSGKPRRGELR